MFGVKKVSKVVSDELYAAKRDMLAQESVVEHNTHALDVAKARLVMLRNRVERLERHANGDFDATNVATDPEDRVSTVEALDRNLERRAELAR